MKVIAWIAATIVVVFSLSWVLIDPHLEDAETYPSGAILRDRAGEVMRVTLGPDDTDCRPYYRARREDWIVKALVASEDRRFFSHHGVNVPSVLRAALQNIFSMRRISGASTITMQATRLFRPHPHNLPWKYVEAFRAMKTELRRDKLWIVSQYLNRAPFGSNLVGIEAAANGWLGKCAGELGIGEAALLAGMVQGPSRFRPDRHLDRALKRRQYVLGRMLALGMITPQQHEGALASVPEIRRGPRPFREPFFCDWAMRHVERRSLAGGDFTTTLDPDIQRRAQTAVGNASHGGTRSAAAVVMRVATGEVLALSCSDDYFSQNAGQVNTALSPRPAGSTLKPFLLACAFDRGLATPEERLADVPRAYQGYNPANFDALYRGSVTASDALVLSLNLPFVEMLSRVGVPQFGVLLRSLGLSNLGATDDSFGLGMAIGNVHVSLLELCSAYASLAHEGESVEPCALASEVRRGDAAVPRMFSRGASWLVADILSGEERSASALGHVADVRVSRFAWKTGTSAAYRDAWTVAWNPEYVVGVWCGHKDGRFGDSAIVGATAAAGHCWNLVRGLYPADNGPWFKRPDEVVERSICVESGMPASPDCPKTTVGRAIRGHSSSAPCTVHRRGANGKQVSNRDAYLAAAAGLSGTRALSISQPDDGTVFRLVRGVANQRVVCKVAGNAAGVKLWWFVDGRSMEETSGDQPFAWTPESGRHVISCTTEKGVSASVHVEVLSE